MNTFIAQNYVKQAFKKKSYPLGGGSSDGTFTSPYYESSFSRHMETASDSLIKTKNKK